jgi:hypothetical protein
MLCVCVCVCVCAFNGDSDVNRNALLRFPDCFNWPNLELLYAAAILLVDLIRLVLTVMYATFVLQHLYYWFAVNCRTIVSRSRFQTRFATRPILCACISMRIASLAQ